MLSYECYDSRLKTIEYTMVYYKVTVTIPSVTGKEVSDISLQMIQILVNQDQRHRQLLGAGIDTAYRMKHG